MEIPKCLYITLKKNLFLRNVKRFYVREREDTDKGRK